MTKQQKKKFIDAARTVGAEDDEYAFDKILGRIAKAPPPETVQDRKTPKGKKPPK